jgi:hypothetical protein
VASDIRGWSNPGHSAREKLRQQRLHREAIETALNGAFGCTHGLKEQVSVFTCACGIAREYTAGDGARVVFPPTCDAATRSRLFYNELDKALMDANKPIVPENWVRLGSGVDIGPAANGDGGGAASDSMITACRLASSDVVKAALIDAPDACLAVACLDHFYQQVGQEAFSDVPGWTFNEEEAKVTDDSAVIKFHAQCWLSVRAHAAAPARR